MTELHHSGSARLALERLSIAALSSSSQDGPDNSKVTGELGVADCAKRSSLDCGGLGVADRSEPHSLGCGGLGKVDCSEHRETPGPCDLNCHEYESHTGLWVQRQDCSCSFANCMNYPVCLRKEPVDVCQCPWRASGDLCMLCYANHGLLKVVAEPFECLICTETRSSQVQLECCRQSICSECFNRIYYRDPKVLRPQPHQYVCSRAADCKCRKCLWTRDNEMLWSSQSQSKTVCPFCRASLYPSWFKVTTEAREAAARVRALLARRATIERPVEL